MRKSEEYLQRAALAEAAAERMADPEIKAQFRKIAQQWRALARQAETLPQRR